MWNLFEFRQKKKTKQSPSYEPTILESKYIYENLRFPLAKLRKKIKIHRALLIVAVAAFIGFLWEYNFLREKYEKEINNTLVDWQIKLDSLTRIHTQTIQYLNKIEATLTGQLLFQDLPSEPLDENFENIYMNEPTKLDNQDDSEDLEDFRNQFSLIGIEITEQNIDLLLIPPAYGIITNGYNPSEDHYAVDIAIENQTPIVSVADGIVIFAEYTLQTGFVIIIKHANDFLTVYKHNSSLIKKQGQSVQAGEVIALGGNTGTFSSGFHLHFEMWVKNQPLNPSNYFNF